MEIRLSNGSKSIKLAMLVDSGADVSLIPLEVAQILELNINDKEKITSSGASGKFDTIGTYVNAELIKGLRSYDLGKMEVRVPLQKSHEPLAFGHVLLGRSHFFRNFDITFRENTFKIILKKPKRR